TEQSGLGSPDWFDHPIPVGRGYGKFGRIGHGSRLVWTNPSCKLPFWVLRPVQRTAVLASLASLRKCEDAERCSCSHRFWTLKSVGYLSEIPTTTVCASSV